MSLGLCLLSVLYCDSGFWIPGFRVALRTVQLLTKVYRTRVKVFLQAMKEKDLLKKNKVADIYVNNCDKLKLEGIFVKIHKTVRVWKIGLETILSSLFYFFPVHELVVF